MKKISYDTIAQAALSQYGIVPDRYHFLGHSESVTFCVESSEKFLLRIHEPISQNQDNGWQKPK